MRIWTGLLFVLVSFIGTPALAQSYCDETLSRELYLRAQARALQDYAAQETELAEVVRYTGFKGPAAALVQAILTIAKSHRGQIDALNEMHMQRLHAPSRDVERQIDIAQSHDLLLLKMQVYKDLKDLFGGQQPGLFIYVRMDSDMMSPRDPFQTGFTANISQSVHLEQGPWYWRSKRDWEVGLKIGVHYDLQNGGYEICVGKACRNFDFYLNPADLREATLLLAPCRTRNSSNN